MFCGFFRCGRREAIDAVPHDHLTFLVTAFGKPFTANGSGNWFHDRCKEAGIKKGLSAHGLRGAGATRLTNEAAPITRSWPGADGRP
jgi:site-specific recombinase XerD